jgi:hypothetical protein
MKRFSNSPQGRSKNFGLSLSKSIVEYKAVRGARRSRRNENAELLMKDAGDRIHDPFYNYYGKCFNFAILGYEK